MKHSSMRFGGYISQLIYEMLNRSSIQILSTKTLLINQIPKHSMISTRSFSRRFLWIENLLGVTKKPDGMSSSLRFKYFLKDFSVTKLWNVWTRNYFIGTVVKRCRKERAVKDMIQCLRLAISHPRKSLLLTLAACKTRKDVEEDENGPCKVNISDEDMEDLLSQLDDLVELSKKTLFCKHCGKRLVIDKKVTGLSYCVCKQPAPLEQMSDGWMPYTEADDCIVWRKEYKPGSGLWAYKVYGRFGDVKGKNFAAANLDNAYRIAWDEAVASLSVVERQANGVPDQHVLHWEVLWPKLFANRDYIFIRRHKEYDVKSGPIPPSPVDRSPFDAKGEPTKEKGPCVCVSLDSNQTKDNLEFVEEHPSVHSNAKRKSIEMYRKQLVSDTAVDNKIYVINSKSCVHPQVPEMKHAIRVTQFWSHMVIKTLRGVDQPGMEFVLTYFDVPAAGGMPGSVTAWVSGRAAPAYLMKMRAAAKRYEGWRLTHGQQDSPDFVLRDVTNESVVINNTVYSEQDMESSKLGPEMESSEQEATTVTKERDVTNISVSKTDSMENFKKEINDASEDKQTSWWRYIYPFYYFW